MSIDTRAARHTSRAFAPLVIVGIVAVCAMWALLVTNPNVPAECRAYRSEQQRTNCTAAVEQQRRIDATTSTVDAR